MIKSKTRRKITVYDFLKLKNYAPFSDWRTVAKGENFGLIFDMSPDTFGRILLNSGFTEKQCDDFIKLSKTTDKLEDLLIKDSMKPEGRRRGTKKCKYFICADFMRTSFFNGYTGLKDRLDREQTFAIENGYVRSYYGPIRNLSELKYMSVNKDKLSITGADLRLYGGLFSHLLANAGNSGVQTQEVRVAMAGWAETRRIAKEWKLKSRIWNSTHDSYDSYVYMPEFEIYLHLINACAAWEREPVHGIHMSLDSELSDISTPESLEKTYYKNGEEVKPTMTIEEAVEKYNNENKTNLKWSGCRY